MRSSPSELVNISVWRGVFWSLVSAILWSTTFVSGRYLIAHHEVDPVTLSFLRYAVGGSVLFGFAQLRHCQELWSVSSVDLIRMVFLALVGLVGMSVFLFFGQANTTAINGSLIMQLSPVLMLLLGVFVGESMSWRAGVSIAVSLFGTLFVSRILGRHGFELDLGRHRGDLLVLAGATCWAIYSVWNKPVVKRCGGHACVAWTMLAGAIELGIGHFIWVGHPIWPKTWMGWGLVVYLGIFPTAVAFFAWSEAMRYIRLSLLGVMQYLTPVFTILIAGAFLGERLDIFQYVGVIIVAVGIVLGFDRKSETT